MNEHLARTPEYKCRDRRDGSRVGLLHSARPLRRRVECTKQQFTPRRRRRRPFPKS